MRLVQVIDTREFEEIADGQWVAIPGSGDARPCDRCGRPHEVHAHVTTDSGTSMIVGTGCAGLGEQAGKKVATKATTLAKLEAQLAKARAALASRVAADAKANAMQHPEPVWGVHENDPSIPIVRVGTSQAWAHLARNEAERAERVQVAIRSWYAERAHEFAGGRRTADMLRNEVDIIEYRMARARKALAKELA